jgi:hypothetical protein
VEKTDTLYHYTNSKGLLGILKERALHATSLHCLNDSTEFSYAFHVTLRITEELNGEHPGLSESVKSALGARCGNRNIRAAQLEAVECHLERNGAMAGSGSPKAKTTQSSSSPGT